MNPDTVFYAAVGVRFTLYLADHRLRHVQPDTRGELGAPDAGPQLCLALDKLMRGLAPCNAVGQRLELADHFMLREMPNPNVKHVLHLEVWLNLTWTPFRTLLEVGNQLESDALLLERDYLKELTFNLSGDEPYCVGCSHRRVFLPALMSPLLLKRPTFVELLKDAQLQKDTDFGHGVTHADLKAGARTDAARRKASPLALSPPRPGGWDGNVTLLRGH
jgi:hypothetical protein